MDESWRMRMGMPTLPRRRSMEDTSSRRPIFATADTLHPEDFSDVFGGPPRSVLARQFTADFTNPTNFYEEIFLPPEFVPTSSESVARSGRSLPAFRIPSRRSEGFYSDIFGSDDDLRRSRERSRPNSKAKSKSNSSSVLSSEDLSPLRPVMGDDVALSSFASKLRWNSSTTMPQEQPRTQRMPTFPSHVSSYTENQFMENDYHENFRRFYNGLPRQVSSPETISLEPNSYRSVKISLDDQEFNSPSSPVSSLCQDPEAKSGVRAHVLSEEELGQEEDEVMSSYVIEINSDHREGTSETVGIDEAIAWAKEKFQTQNYDKDLSQRQHNEQSAQMEGRPNESEISDQLIDGNEIIQSPEEEEQRNWTVDEAKVQSEDMEVELLDEYIRMWSAGKETNIKLLLSTLHHILWPNSGWNETPLTSLIESSQVKKTYQKARLCLHPDKLQQRGATLPQKYIAEKAFSVLQDAWAAFINQDVFYS